jgi:S1-C subfamily serine protease
VVGSGFLVDDQGHIVTNYHVVDGAGEIEVRMFGGLVVSATLLGYSRADDLALLQVDPAEVAGIKPLSLADSSEISPGEMAIAIGSPFGYPSSISVGVVSGTSVSRPSVLRRPIPDMVQTDAALNPGNSGGPLLNSKGEVIGISTSVQVFASVDTGVGFAVSSNTLRGVLQELTQPGELKRPWIGISGEPITRSLSILLGLPSETGIYVSVVLDDGPAARADIRGDSGGTSGQGDIIIAVDGEKVASVADLVDYLNTLRPGDEVTLTIIREGETKDVGVTLAEWDS